MMHLKGEAKAREKLFACEFIRQAVVAKMFVYGITPSWITLTILKYKSRNSKEKDT